MLPNLDIPLGIKNLALLLAQVEIEPETGAELAQNAQAINQGPQFFTTLVAGVVLAFAIQMLLTNLGVAAGISAIGGLSDSSSSSSSSSNSDNSGSAGSTIKKIGLGLGLATLISVTIALFVASWLAVKLSLYFSPLSGAILGLVIWATYFSLLMWAGSTTVGSLVGSIVNSATSGFQALVGTATAAIAGQSASRQVVKTAEAAAGAVRRELSSAVDPEGLREKVEDYLEGLRPPQLNIKEITSEFEKIIKEDPTLAELADKESLRNLDRQTFVDLVSSRSDLSPREINKLADRLERVWKTSLDGMPSKKDAMSQLKEFISEATPTDLGGQQLSQKLDELVKELRGRSEAENSSGEDSNGPLSQALTMASNSLVGMVMGRTDISDINVEKIIKELKRLPEEASESVKKITPSSDDRSGSIVRTDIENYLANTYPWKMTPEKAERDFRSIIYDPNADPTLLAKELRQMSRSDFAQMLADRGVFTKDQIKNLANRLETLRLQAISQAEAAAEQETKIELGAEVEEYLSTTPAEELTKEKILLNFKPILEDPEANFEQLKNRLSGFDSLTLETILQKRGDINPTDVAIIVQELENARDRVLLESRDQQEKAKAAVKDQWLKVLSYLRDTGKGELSPEGVERDLKTLLDDPQAGIAALRERASRFDRDTAVKLVTARNDLSEEQVEQVLDSVEETWTKVSSKPQALAGKAKKQYEDAMLALTSYLRKTGKPELNPAGIKRDLNKLFEDPKAGARSLKRRLAQVDRDTLVQLLAQRQDLNETEIQQTIDEVLDNLRGIAKVPQRAARRTQAKVQDFKSTVADYLRSTDKAELSPTGIKRDVKLLLNDPSAGMESLRDRLSAFDRETLVALLSQREDMTQEDVHQIVDRITEARDEVMEQLQRVKRYLETKVKRIFARIRDYLNTLDRPELDYDGIGRDFRTLFDDPNAGFEALRDRLSGIDRDTVVAILSSRDDISKTDADMIIARAERTRDRALQRAERFQMQAKMQMEKMKQDAQRQAEETRKAAATAAWWLFSTALVSGIASAIAGVIAVVS